jgi:predicted TIM-barrel fold metal-dependent hydrolase
MIKTDLNGHGQFRCLLSHVPDKFEMTHSREARVRNRPRRSKLGVIDIHTHLHPPRLTAAIRRWFAERSPWKLYHPTEPQEVAQALRAAGVERFVFFSYAHKPGIARDLNTWVAQTSRDLDGYGLPLATVHLADAGHLDDLRDALTDGCIGLKIHEDVQQLSADDPRFDAVYAMLAAHEAYALVHVGPIPWSADTRNGPARIAAVLERHPTLRVVVAHMGVPDTRAYLELAARTPNLFLDTTMSFASDDLRTDLTAADVESASGSIVYGTDYPNIPYEYDGDRRGLEALNLSPAAHAAIFAGNARKLHERLAG